MITTAQVGWAGYNKYEGPWFRGQCGFQRVEPTDSLSKKILAVITSTEGGRYDAINMYDRMICSVGLIQWGDAGQFSVCDMLGEVFQADESALTGLIDYVNTRGFSFNRASKRWRFSRGGAVVDTIAEQQDLYLAGSSGLKGQWTEAQKNWARGFVVAMQSVWASPRAQEAQLRYTVERLTGFATPSAKAALFTDPGDADPNIVQATQAAYLSFAANLPAVASSQLQKLQTSAPKWSIEWLSALLKQLTFGPQIAIYPIRYNAIRPVIERLWGIDLPDTSKELAAWQKKMSIDPAAPEEVRLDTPRAIQQALLTLHYDLGPAGADGVVGPKTRKALAAFQVTKGLQVTGAADAGTLIALRQALLEVTA